MGNKWASWAERMDSLIEPRSRKHDGAHFRRLAFAAQKKRAPEASAMQAWALPMLGARLLPASSMPLWPSPLHARTLRWRKSLCGRARHSQPAPFISAARTLAAARQRLPLQFWREAWRSPMRWRWKPAPHGRFESLDGSHSCSFSNSSALAQSLS